MPDRSVKPVRDDLAEFSGYGLRDVETKLLALTHVFTFESELVLL